MGQRGRPKKEKPEMSEQQETPTFAESKGLESNQHAKKLAKESAQKKEQKSDIYYTSNGSKVLSLKVNESGVFKEYVGSLSKKAEASQIKISIEKWKSQGKWIEPHALKEFCLKLITK
jgi:hypothetical protein